jgi:acyl carrier protein
MEEGMPSPEMISRLNRIFQKVFEDSTLVVNETMTARDVDNWDSLNHLELILSVEEEFGIKFSLGELQDMKNVGMLAQSIEAKTTA